MVIKPKKQNQISFGYCDTVKGERVYPVPVFDPMAESELLPEQLPPERAEQTSLDGANENGTDMQFTCWPPLGQGTTVSAGQDAVEIFVLLERPSTTTEQHPEVVIWHNVTGENDWSELTLHTVPASTEMTIFDDHGSERKYTHYSATLNGRPKDPRTVSFTLKFRSTKSSDWRWIRSTTGISDGALHYAITDLTSASSLDDLITNMSSDIKAERVESEVPSSHLWSLTCSVGPAKGLGSGYQQHRLGHIIHSEKWFALVRLWSPWLAPRQGTKAKFELDKEGVLLSFLRSDGLHVVCLAISGIEDVLTTFINDGEGNVEIKGRNDRESKGTCRVLVAVAQDFERANAATMYHAREIVAGWAQSQQEGGGALLERTKTIETLVKDEVKPEWLEEWYDGLTYCTWNGLGQKLTAQRIIDAMENLAKNGITITNLIIDDNWQSLSEGKNQFQRGHSRFEANSEGFPEGMKALTKELRDKFNINYIAVWHAILGYWGGIDPNGDIAKRYKTRLVEKEPGVAGGTFTVVDPSDVQQFYNDFYAFLSESGITGVKTDAQFFLDLLLHAPDRRQMITEYQDAWTIAHLRHFSSRAISCMSQFPQSLFHTQLPNNKPRLLVRNSDDFFPEVEASHPWHIFCNAHNSVLTQHLNALPDLDMFQTLHPWAGFHAAARCVSGGPIYFTDKPGEHDAKLIRQMTAQTTRGKSVILRPHRIGRAVDVYAEYGSPSILKMATYVGMSGTGSGILGCFNVSKQHLREFVPLSAFPGSDSGSEYIISSFYSRPSFSQPISTKDKHAKVHLSLPPGGPDGGWDVLTAHPVGEYVLHNGKEKTKLSVLGLLNKMTGIAAVVNSDIVVESSGRLRVWIGLKALGTLGLWISDLTHRDVDNHFLVMMGGTVLPRGCVKRTLLGEKGEFATGKGARKDGILEVDIEKAWREMGLKPGWGNETSVEIFIS